MPFVNRARVKRRYQALPAAIQKAAAAQLEANAEELVQTQKQFADLSFSDPTGETQASIRQEDASTAERPIRRRVIADAKDEKGRPKAQWIENGTSSSPPRPFFWPAYRAKRKAFRQSMQAAARKAIREVMKR